MNRIISYILTVLLVLISLYFFSSLSSSELPLIEAMETGSESFSDDTEKESFQKQSLSLLARHFPDEYIPPVVEDEPVPDVIPAEKTTITSGNISYVATVVKNSVKYFFFKTRNTGKIITLSSDQGDGPWSLLSVEDSYFILSNGESEFKVIK